MSENNYKLDKIDQDMINTMNEIKAMNQEHYAKTGKKRLGLIRTYGCQMNILRLI